MLEKSSMWRRTVLSGLIAFIFFMPGTGFLAAQPPDVMSRVEDLLKQGKTDDAIGLLQSEIERSPDRMDLHLGLGEIYRRKGDLTPAIESLRRAKRLAPDNVIIVST